MRATFRRSTLTTWLCICWTCATGSSWKVSKPKKPAPPPKPRPALCYDCDYDPDDAQVRQDKAGGKERRGYGGGGGSGGTKATAGKSADSRRGFPRCALDSGDERFVRLTECHSRTCFIRRDHNGRTYELLSTPLV